jgi:hypothetical protein
MKRNGWHTSKTIGPESIQEISDYREIDLEALLLRDFELFAAELLFFRLIEHVPDLQDKVPIAPDQLRDIDRISERFQNETYKKRVLSAAESILPRVTDRAAASLILNDDTLRSHLIRRIKSALQVRGSKLKAEQFVDDSVPEASVVCHALLHRPRETPEALRDELDALKNGGVSRLEQTGDLIANNLFGCVNAIFMDAQRDSLLFTGFSVLTLMSRGNARYFLELVHRIFRAHNDYPDGELPVVPTAIQARAVRDASEAILNTISGHGTYGPRLFAMASCLGSIFRELHRTERQSETEVSHFTLASSERSGVLATYLAEAEKWSVLFVSKETKMKSAGNIAFDYVLNPIFSAYYQISFRKKRSLSLTARDLLLMLDGDQRDRDRLVREIGKKDKYIDTGDLFGGIE